MEIFPPDHLPSSDPVMQILLIGFHHQKGSIVDYSHPFSPSLPVEWKHLPHMALPDGCHNYNQGHVMFTLPSLSSSSPPLLFGVSCYRQINSSELIDQSTEITRSTVQKSITIISTWPLYDFFKSKLELTTCAYFNSKNFTDQELLIQTFDNLNSTLNKELALGICCHSNQLPNQIDRYGYIILQIFKAILLEKRIIIYGSDPGNVSELVTDLLSLLPYHNQHLISSLSTNKQGLPLSHFAHLTNIRPYLPLQEIKVLQDETKDGGLLVGVANPLFYKKAQELSDICLVTESRVLEIYSSDLNNQLTLSTADLRFCRLLKESVISGKEEESESVAVGNWSGSTEWIQLQFKEYLMSLLLSCCHGNLLVHEDFNIDFIRQFTKTGSFCKWMTSTPPPPSLLTGDNTPGHICKGDLSLDDLKHHLLVEVNDLVGQDQVEQIVRKTGDLLVTTSEKVSNWWDWSSTAVKKLWGGNVTNKEEESS